MVVHIPCHRGVCVCACKCACAVCVCAMCVTERERERRVGEKKREMEEIIFCIVTTRAGFLNRAIELRYPHMASVTHFTLQTWVTRTTDWFFSESSSPNPHSFRSS